MLLLQPLEAHIGRGLVISHVLVPRGGKPEELLLLRLLHLVHLVLLRLLDEPALPLFLLRPELLVLPARLLRLHVLAVELALLPVRVQALKERQWRSLSMSCRSAEL